MFVALWFVMLVLPGGLFLVSIVVGLMAHQEDVCRLHRDGVCDGCGYDLRGTPERCPECGLVVRER